MALSVGEKLRLKTKYGSWALVTGASSGIGHELAERLAEAGIHLLLTSRRLEALQTLASDLTQRYGVQTRVLATDLTAPKGIDLLIEASSDLDVGLLVAAAGFGTSGLFVERDLDTELNMLELNCTAVLKLSHHFSRVFKARKKGGIILMSSIVSFQGVPYAAHYAATKAYVHSLAEALSIELKPFGVDVLAAAPGPVNSSFGERAAMNLGKALKPSDIGVAILQALGKRTVVYPGLLTKILTGSLSTLPRWGKVRVMKLVMGGMTKHQRSKI